MRCANKTAFRLGMSVYFILILTTGALGIRRHRSAHRLAPKPNIDDLLQRLDNTLQEQRKRLERGLPTIAYRTHHQLEDDEGPTIIQDHWEAEMTHAEEYMSDVEPWTRTSPTPQPTLTQKDLKMVQLASENVRWVKDNGKCEVPLQRCVKVTSQHGGARYKYWPRCALLHRCGDDAGCCIAPGHSCSVESAENVDLFFYVYTDSGDGRAGVQKMTFSNHTRCACKPSEVSNFELEPPAPVICNCPKHFTSTPVGGRCTCICTEGNPRCKRYKKGKRFFSSSETECISNGECTTPTCEYGPFLLKKHRCPRRRERERYTVSRR
ncbi:uncharacterized protein [Penaeus vannamei]|uniref:uncharacterized protein n=1 Tax=Penaeus vannamei TaxID=6689 RepID=UPI00387FA16C